VGIKKAQKGNREKEKNCKRVFESQGGEKRVGTVKSRKQEGKKEDESKKLLEGKGTAVGKKKG